MKAVKAEAESRKSKNKGKDERADEIIRQSDDELAQWAIKDYQDKTGVTAASAEVKPISDDKYEIVLKDADGNILDTYTINPETGIGTNSSNDAVDLPQTGMSGAHKAIAGLAALMTLTGVALVAKSRRKDEDQ